MRVPAKLRVVFLLLKYTTNSMSKKLDDKFSKLDESAQKLLKIRHTTEHVLHTAMQNLYPELKKAMGPATDDGFYFDFDLDKKVTETDFPRIEKEMKRIIKTGAKMVRQEIRVKDAKKLFSSNPYKVDWINEIAERGESYSTYQMVASNGKVIDQDLCSGPHLDSLSEIGAFKLLSVAGAYWHGDEKNKMLTRIYGTAFSSKKELDDYIFNIEEAKKRDHRKLGKDLELFTFSNDVGQGLTIWLPNGSIMRREIENYMVKEQTKMGYKHVYSPHIGQKSLWEKSGHWDLYREKMYSPMDVDGIEYLVKPMTCPMHIQTYEFKPRSYRDLPFRIAEVASVYRYEQSGELSGLLRVRSFTQDDAHIFGTPEQVVDEFLSVFSFIQRLYKSFGFTSYRVRLGVRSKKEKYLGDDSLWKKAQDKAISALKKVGADYFISEGDAAFYGPKADFLIKDALGREWQCGTVQIDFMLPERFGLKYTDHEGKEKTPIMVHRAPLGSLERFLAILIEQYAGAFPLWLSPLQVMVLPISEKYLDYAKTVVSKLSEKDLRVELDISSESVGKKIRNAETKKIPYMLVVGEKEQDEGTVAVRSRGVKEQKILKVEEFVSEALDRINRKED